MYFRVTVGRKPKALVVYLQVRITSGLKASLLCVFVAMHRLSLVVASGGYSLLWCLGFSLRWLLSWSSDSRHTGFSSCSLNLVVMAHSLWSAGSVVAPHGLSCSVARGIFPDQGSNPCPLHLQADSDPLYPPAKSHSFLFKL